MIGLTVCIISYFLLIVYLIVSGLTMVMIVWIVFRFWFLVFGFWFLVFGF